MTKVLVQIVGQYHRKPADRILRRLPIGYPLILRREPSNPHDPNAIAVLMLPGDHNDEDLCIELRKVIDPFFTWMEFASLPHFQLGYLPAVDALSFVQKGWPPSDVEARFALGASNKPALTFNRD